MPWCISTLKLALGLFLAVSLANVAAVAASDVAIAVGVAVVVDFFVLFINLICSHKPWQQKDQVSVVSAHCTKPTLKLVASILWRILMAAHVLISYTLLFSPIVVAVWAYFFQQSFMRFLALYQSLLLNLHRCIRRQQNKTQSSPIWLGNCEQQHQDTIYISLLWMGCSLIWNACGFLRGVISMGLSIKTSRR